MSNYNIRYGNGHGARQINTQAETVSEAKAKVRTEAGRMLGAAEDIRARKGLPTRSPLSFFEPFLDRLLTGPDAPRFEAARRLGREAELADIVEAALA